MPRPGSPPNVAAPTAAEELRSWSDRFGLLEDANRRAMLTKARPAHVAARLYPVAAIALVAQWLTVNFLVDDMLDAEDDPGRCDTIADGLLRMFAFDAPTAADPLSAAVADLWRRTTAGRSTGWCRAFRADHAAWLGTYAREAVDRASGRVPRIDEYRRHRRLSSGMLVFVDLVEVALGVDLADAVRRLDPVHTLRAVTSEYMGLVNDIYSVSKELASGQVHNAVYVVMHHTGVDIAEALRVADDMATECLREFEDVTRSLGPADDVRLCVRGYRMLMRGAVDCCADLDRYATPSLAIPGVTSA
jgi:(+)-beta-caryophyllene/(+)-caryolan-1-ol synthase